MRSENQSSLCLYTLLLYYLLHVRFVLLYFDMLCHTLRILSIPRVNLEDSTLTRC